MFFQNQIFSRKKNGITCYRFQNVAVHDVCNLLATPQFKAFCALSSELVRTTDRRTKVLVLAPRFVCIFTQAHIIAMCASYKHLLLVAMSRKMVSNFVTIVTKHRDKTFAYRIARIIIIHFFILECSKIFCHRSYTCCLWRLGELSTQCVI